MNKDHRKNSEGYNDPTAYEAMKRCKDPRRQLQGKRSKIVGEYFENLITSACDFYYDRDIAHIEKTPEPMKVLKPMPRQPGKFIACFEKAAQPDYKGTINGGRAIVFEAKHTDGDRIERSRLTQEQLDGLEKHHKLGAFTFVLVSFKFQSYFRIPWDIWRDMKRIYGRRYIKPEELEKYRVSATSQMILLLSGIV
ncbi:Holliday junction resolvase RecU [Desulfosporosinus nitroreducens]|uniref:Holliday junction resolvase RecU n=1 Tax=Desulfosporosinus nitroreducens TaxID=2018668 RepID=UPI00207CF53C|nr:Holliday junction resolvase RecU [Desulfosporosinus nitroreducens]MCO1599774.1 Holliday junction resolvase RecU [Desulfosporosinus nitroreducens]